MTIHRLFLSDLPPSVNKIWVCRAGRVVRSAHYEHWIKSTMIFGMGNLWRFKWKSVRVTIPTQVRGDVDNYLKTCIDLMVKREITVDDRHLECAQIVRSKHKTASPESRWPVLVEFSDKGMVDNGP